MKREILQFDDEASWLRARDFDVTSSDAAALCNVGRKTRYDLWHQKIRGQPAPFEETEAMRLGKIMEPAIAAHLAKEHGFEVEPMKQYIRMPDVRLGSSFDYVAKDRSFLLEIKLVGIEQFRCGWEETDFGLEAPIDIEAQVQQEMLLAEIPLAFIGVLCGTKTYLLRREYQTDVGERFVREAKGFWTSPEPTPDFYRDGKLIARLYGHAEEGKVIDADERILALLRRYDEQGRIKRIADDEQQAAKAELLTLIGDAERVQSDEFNVSAKVVGPTEIAAFTRQGFRNLRITQRKQK